MYIFLLRGRLYTSESEVIFKYSFFSNKLLFLNDD